LLELSEPFLNVDLIQFLLPQHNGSGVFEVARPTGDQFMDDDVFRRGKIHINSIEVQRPAALNGEMLVQSKREDQINTYLGLVILGSPYTSTAWPPMTM
jgi:hypothetical protein